MSSEDDSSSGLLLKPIGVIKSWFKTKNGTPRQGSLCPDSKAVLRLNKTFFTNPHHALHGLLTYSHIWLIFHFHKNTNKGCKAKVHPPRLDGETVGVFASRAPHRPNPLGLTLAKVERVEDNKVYMSGIDILDGTPIFDIKPYIEKYDQPHANNNDIIDETIINGQSREQNYTALSATSPDNVEDLQVDFTSQSLQSLQSFHRKLDGHDQPECDYCLEYLDSSADAQRAICSLLRADPRSVYRRNKCSDRLYYFSLDRIHVTCWFDSETNSAQIVKIKAQPKEENK
ncbi:putative S-adenosylmethionine-dependent methyltransferase RcsF [Halotydeus destructor]|nr:putative S-adenosylmethionine-dependent methyltransferase RcsF [Halotydeus destructor]